MKQEHTNILKSIKVMTKIQSNKSIIERAFNEVLRVKKDYNLCPPFYYNVETLLKLWCDGRYSLFIKAGTKDSCIVSHANRNYYVYYDYTTKQYICEND